MDAELREAVSTSRAAVKSLHRHARHCTQILADLERRLDALDGTDQPHSPGGTANGNHRDTQVPARV